MRAARGGGGAKREAVWSIMSFQLLAFSLKRKAKSLEGILLSISNSFNYNSKLPPFPGTATLLVCPSENLCFPPYHLMVVLTLVK
jgi:hypothetical protein